MVSEDSGCRIAIKPTVPSAYKSRNTCFQPFLLIDRTCRIVTTSELHDYNVPLECNSQEASLMSSSGFNRCFQHIAKFIDSAYVHCLTRVIPYYYGHRLYLHPISRGRRFMASVFEMIPSCFDAIPSLWQARKSLQGHNTPLLRRCRSTSAAEIRFVFE